MQRGSQIRLNGYGDLKTTARSCYGQHGSHCDPWAVQVEIIQSQSAELAVAVERKNRRFGRVWQSLSRPTAVDPKSALGLVARINS